MKKYIIKIYPNNIYNYNTYMGNDDLKCSSPNYSKHFNTKEEAIFHLQQIAKERKVNGFGGVFEIIEVYIY